MTRRSVTNRSLLLAELDRTSDPDMRERLLTKIINLKTSNPDGNQTKLRKPGKTRPHSLSAAQIAHIKRHEKPVVPAVVVDSSSLDRFLSDDSKTPSEQLQDELEPILPEEPTGDA